MNDIFSFNRFWHLCRKTVFENWLVFVGINLLTTIVLLYFFYVFPVNIAEGFTYPFIIMSGTIFTSILMNQFSPKSKPISYLTFPASTFEKWLVIILIGVFLYFIYFVGIHHVLTAIFYNIEKGYPQYSRNSLLISSEKVETINIYYFILQAFTMVLCLYFNRNAYVKGVILVLFLTIFSFFLNSLIGSIFFGEGIKNIETFGLLEYVKNGKSYFLELPKETFDRFMFFFKYLLAPILFAISYVRLKEKEA